MRAWKLEWVASEGPASHAKLRRPHNEEEKWKNMETETRNKTRQMLICHSLWIGSMWNQWIVQALICNKIKTMDPNVIKKRRIRT